MSYHSSSFPDYRSASRVLQKLRAYGASTALSQIQLEYRSGIDGLLLAELHKRLLNDPSPRLLIDGLWFCHGMYGGISRVWTQILRTFSLPPLSTAISPIFFINRSHLRIPGSSINNIISNPVDPLDYSAVHQLSYENQSYVHQCKADVFCSTWLSSSGPILSSCHEIALIHDCIPERFTPKDPKLIPLRSRFITGTASALSVSFDTSLDLNSFYQLTSNHTAWCHPACSDSISSPCNRLLTSDQYQHILSSIGLSKNFIVLPGSGLLGSYKNPDIVAQALSHRSTDHLDLLVTGINSSAVQDSILSEYPNLYGRVFSAGFTDLELLTVFFHAVAVVIPSLVEGFGLPVIEVMEAGGFPLIANSIGLREAGAEVALRFDSREPSQLIALIQLLSDKKSREWLSIASRQRLKNRLSRLNPDLLGLSLLSQARSVY